VDKLGGASDHARILDEQHLENAGILPGESICGGRSRTAGARLSPAWTPGRGPRSAVEPPSS